MPELNEEQQLNIFRSFAKWFALAITVLVALPTLYCYLIRPAGSMYLGIQYNLDDHMVYAGWMKQAMEGHLTFENRFTTDQQPALTIHLYFLVLGWIAKIAGIPLTMTLARLGFTFLSVILLGRLIEFVTDKIYSRKVALGISVLGGGIGFAVWHNFGRIIVLPTNQTLKGLLLHRLPNDVWQPEGFFLYSAFTNSLFMVSLCLILGVLINVLRARETSKAVLPGAICFGLLMNIHSYDVLLIAVSLVGFVAALAGSKMLDKPWVLRALVTSLGVVPFALWFIYVLKNDAVFQARAATLTYSPNFRQIFFGYVLLIIPALVAVFDKRKNTMIGVGLMVAVLIGLNVAASTHLTDSYYMSMGVWTSIFGLVLISLYLIRPEKPGVALIVAWAFVGIIAPYFPALFQRKLTMMLSVPWGILAGVGVAMVLEKQDRGQRNLLTALALVVFSATGIRWFSREITLAKKNVATPPSQSVYYSRDVLEIINRLSPLGRNAVIAALPGSKIVSSDEDGNPTGDSFDSPPVPDLNPILVGLAGCRTFAGHWSETPDYRTRVRLLSNSLMDNDGSLNSLGINYLIIPKDGLSHEYPPESYGTVEFKGSEWALIKLSQH